MKSVRNWLLEARERIEERYGPRARATPLSNIERLSWEVHLAAAHERLNAFDRGLSYLEDASNYIHGNPRASKKEITDFVDGLLREVRLSVAEGKKVI